MWTKNVCNSVLECPFNVANVCILYMCCAVVLLLSVLVWQTFIPLMAVSCGSSTDIDCYFFRLRSESYFAVQDF